MGGRNAQACLHVPPGFSIQTEKKKYTNECHVNQPYQIN